MIEFIFWFIRYSTRFSWFHPMKICWKSCGGMSGDLNNFSCWLFHSIFNIINLYFVVSFICNGINQTCALTFGRNGFSLATLIQNLGFAELFHRVAMNPHQRFYRRPRWAAALKPARYAWSSKCGTMMKISSDKWKWIRRSVAALFFIIKNPYFCFHLNFLGRQPVEKWNWTSRQVAPNALLFSSSGWRLTGELGEGEWSGRARRPVQNQERPARGSSRATG